MAQFPVRSSAISTDLYLALLFMYYVYSNMRGLPSPPQNYCPKRGVWEPNCAQTGSTYRHHHRRSACSRCQTQPDGSISDLVFFFFSSCGFKLGGSMQTWDQCIFEFMQYIGEMGARHLSDKEDLRSPVGRESAAFSIRGQLGKTHFCLRPGVTLKM